MYSLLRCLSKCLSYVLHPVFIPTYAMILFCHVNFRIQDLGGFLYMIYWTFFLTVVSFGGILSLLVRLGMLENVYMRERAERIIPYWVSLFVSFLWCCVLQLIWECAPIFVWLAGASTCVLLMVIIINYWWKISAHLAGMGTLIGCVLGYSHYVGRTPLITLGVLMLLSWLLMCARIFLKEHTPDQTVVGFLLGIVITYFSSLFCP